MKFSVVTPCLDAAAHIEETVASVLGQSALRDGGATLEYLVCDGGSTDGTLERLAKIASPALRVVSRADRGMYDALSRGLKHATGDVVAYLNAGDYFHPHAFAAVRDVMTTFPDCRWLTGYAVDYNAAGSVVRVVLPYRFRRPLIRAGAYDGGLLPFIQQESTFWRRELQAELDYDALAGLRYAGDALLWRTFARSAELHVAATQLGGFRFHAGQLSENLHAYLAELRGLAEPAGILDRWWMLADRVLWFAPPAVKQRLAGGCLHIYDQAAGRWTR